MLHCSLYSTHRQLSAACIAHHVLPKYALAAYLQRRSDCFRNRQSNALLAPATIGSAHCERQSTPAPALLAAAALLILVGLLLPIDLADTQPVLWCSHLACCSPRRPVTYAPATLTRCVLFASPDNARSWLAVCSVSTLVSTEETLLAHPADTS